MNEQQQWFYAVGEDQRGPISSEDLRGKLICGELPVDTLVWSEGMASWASAEKVPDLFRPAPPKPEPQPVVIPPQVEASAAGSGPMGGQASNARPAATPQQMQRNRQAWHRFLARTADVFLFSNVLALFFVGNASTEAGFLDLALSAAFTLGVWAFVEALFVSRWGMTPGKWIFRIRVVHEENRYLTYGEALQRSFMVLLQGQFFGIPPMNLIFQALAFKDLVETDSTQWDRKVRTMVQHAPMRGVHIGAAVFLLVMVLMGAAQMAQQAG